MNVDEHKEGGYRLDEDDKFKESADRPGEYSGISQGGPEEERVEQPIAHIEQGILVVVVADSVGVEQRPSVIVVHCCLLRIVHGHRASSGHSSASPRRFA